MRRKAWYFTVCEPTLAYSLFSRGSCDDSSPLLIFAKDSFGGRTLGTEELSGDVEGLAANDDNLLSVQELLGDGAGQATEQVALAIDDNLL